MPDEGSGALVVLRCRSCGDTFAIHAGDERVCRSCESEDVQTAHEPLL